MVVQSSERGGADAAGEFLPRAELELKKEREMGGDFEHIACRCGDDYDSNETEGSFVMVKSVADSDARSDSSEKEIELDVGAGVADRPGASGALPLIANWGSSTVVDDERVDGWKIESEARREGMEGDEVGREDGKDGESSSEIEEKPKEMGEGDQVQTAEVMHVTGEAVDFTRSDHELKEEDDVVGEILKSGEEQEQNDVLASEDPKDEPDTAIEHSSEADREAEVVVMAVEDSKGEEEEVSEDLNDENEAVAGIKEGVSDGMEVAYVDNEAGISCEGQAIRAASSPVTSADAVNADYGLESVLEESKVVESSVSRPLNNEVEAVSGIEEGKKVNDVSREDAEFFVNREWEVDFAPEIKERRVSTDEVADKISTSDTEPGKKEVNSTSDFEEERKINDEESVIVEFSTTDPLEREFDFNTVIESEDTKYEGSKDTDFSITDLGEQVGSPSLDEVGKSANKNITYCGNEENEIKSAIQEDENQQIKALVIDSDSVHSDLSASAKQVQPKDVGASPANPASKEKEDDSFLDLIAQPAEETFSNINQQNTDSPTDSFCMDRDLRSSSNQIQQQDVDASRSKFDSEEKEPDSSIESIAEHVEERIGSSYVFEEYQVAEASSINQIPESVNQDVGLASPAENEHVEALSIENQQSKTSPTDSDFVDKELTHDVVASLSKSDSEAKENDSSLELIAESVKEDIGASSIDEQYIVADGSSIDQNPMSVNEGTGLASLAEEKSEVMSIMNQQIKNSPTESERLTQDLDASLPKPVIEEKKHDSCNESFTKPAEENIVSSSIFEESEVAKVLSNDQMPENVHDDVYLASRTDDKTVEPLSLENQQSKDSPTGSDSVEIEHEDKHFMALSMHNQQSKSLQTDSDSVDRDLNSSVEKVQLRDVDASLTNFVSEEKEHESSTELIAEPFKDNIGSSSMVEEAPSIGQSSGSISEDAKLASRVQDEHVEPFSMENQQIKSLPTGSDSVDRDLRSSIEHVQQEDVNASLSESALEEKEPDSCIKLIVEPSKENSISSYTLDKNQVVEDSSFVQSSVSVEDINFASGAEDKHFTNLSIDENLVPFKEELVSKTKTEENKHEENYDSEALITKGVSERMDEQLVTEVASLKALSVEDLNGAENQQIDLKSVKEHGPEDIVAKGQKRELKSATMVEELLETHLHKDLGEITEQQEELKSEQKQSAEHIEQYQDSATPSLSDGAVENVEKIAKKFYIIKIPRFTQRVIDNELQQKIHEAQIKVNEHTSSRDAIMAELEDMRKVLSDCCHKRDFAVEEEKKARTLVNAKRQEMDSLQSVISKGNTAASFLDIASQVQTLSHKIQHETVSLKEEKKLIYDLKQLEHEQEHHLFNKCSQQEVDEALRQKETAESSLKALKKEFDLLRSAHLKSDEFAKAASKIYINQFNKVKEHEKKWRAANDLRQKAYKDFHGLKSDKMDHFWKYIDDRQAARKYTSSRDIDALERHCTEQIERILHLWNEDGDFRRQYIESNLKSTLRRFGTLDGRTIGLNEEAAVLPSCVPPPLSTRSLATPVKVQEERPRSAREISRHELQAKKMVRLKQSSKSTTIENTPAIVSAKEEIVEEVKLERNMEEVEREALELKEKIRMEQKAKAKEAEERKRRKSEKALARAEYKAQKAAELREQKRVKKEKKKDELPETTRSTEGENASVTDFSSHENSPEPERILKKSTRQSAVAPNKYKNRVQPVPLPLRNKGKRRSSMLVWTLCCAVAVGGLIFAGNYVSFTEFNLLDFGF
ncbi:hypothetical protein KSP40_PGU016393 [Platanthera guangdongensis]|uniref:Uncharacterized protein n=1 Tax=Platanthera guangdongensis TaxID=2320717 RepID=A0ABR2MKS8_9ASPA